jgi:hypothetical protein
LWPVGRSRSSRWIQRRQFNGGATNSA